MTGSDRAPAVPRRSMSLFGRPLGVVIISVEKGISAVLSAAGAVLALILHNRRITDPIGLFFPGEVGEAPRDIFVRWLQRHVPHPSPALALLIGIGLAFWAVLLLAESIGVWFSFGWGEFLIIVETGAFLPIEVWHLARHPSLAALGTIGVNLLILGYVVGLYRRRLARRAERAASARRVAGRTAVTGEED